MLVLQNDVKSHNSVRDITPGVYKGFCQIYEPTAGGFVVFNRFSLKSYDNVTVSELIILQPNGDQSFLDFVRLRDRRWRDTNGLIKNNLIDLLPLELLNFRPIREYFLAEETVGRVQ
jgi:hypothetical protein